MTAFILAGDIGGTKTLLQAVLWQGGKAEVLAEQHFDSGAFGGLASMLRDFIALAGADGKIRSACFAVAGSVRGRCVQLTNLPWSVDAAEIERGFGIARVELINDFQAAALGIDALAPNDLVTLQAGQAEPRGVRAVLGAGTGMGVAWSVWQGDRYLAWPTEAGHMDFAPLDETQFELLKHLRQKFGRVSYERVLSGPGLVDVFDFLQSSVGRSAPELMRFPHRRDDAARVTELALNRKHPLAVKALDMFVEIYGAFAGNLALAGLARGGVFVAGGIAPKIIGKLQEGAFLAAFRDKGRYAKLMQEIPVQVVMNPKLGLLGAALSASRLGICA